jgi:uncharacterized protein (DUF1778 family)
MTTSTRCEFRIPADDKERIEAAAALVNVNETASDFARSAAISRADEVLRRQERTEVPADFFGALLRELDQPSVPNNRMVRAAERARKLLVYGDQG